MVIAVFPLDGSDYLEGPVFGVYSQVDQWFVRDSAPHLFSVLEPSPYFILNKFLDASFCIMLRRHIGVGMPTVFLSKARRLPAELLSYQWYFF